MRIGIFTDFYLPHVDGVTRSIETFRIALEQMGHQVYIFAPGDGIVGYKDNSSRIIRFPAVKIKQLGDNYASFVFPPAAARTIDKLRLDIIHSQNPGVIGLLGANYAIKNNLPLVATYHGDAVAYIKHYPALFPATFLATLLSPFLIRGGRKEIIQSMRAMRPERKFDDWNEKMLIESLKMLYSNCNHLIVPSLKMEQHLRVWDMPTPITILPTGVDKITTKKGEIETFRLQFDLKPEDKLVLYVGRLGTEKNLELLVRSFPLVLKKCPDARLILAGDHPKRAVLQKLINSLGIHDQARITGYIEHDQLGAIYDSADVFAFPSMTDTQGLVVNEAAAAGLPLVLTDPTINAVLVDGKSGYAAKDNPKDFAAKLVKLLQDDPLRYEMGREARRQAIKYTTGKQAAKLLRLYQDVIKRHREQSQPQARKSWIRRRRDT